MNKTTTTDNTTRHEDPSVARIKAANKIQWDNLTPGKIELTLSPQLVSVLKTLHARGYLSDLHPPEVHMQSLLYVQACYRERGTKEAA